MKDPNVHIESDKTTSIYVILFAYKKSDKTTAFWHFILMTYWNIWIGMITINQNDIRKKNMIYFIYPVFAEISIPKNIPLGVITKIRHMSGFLNVWA